VEQRTVYRTCDGCECQWFTRPDERQVEQLVAAGQVAIQDQLFAVEAPEATARPPERAPECDGQLTLD
jgi:hypothetical protein